MTPNVHPGTGCVRPTAWCGVLALLLIAGDIGAAGMALRLDRTLSDSIPGPVGEGTEVLLRFGSSEIRAQIELTRDRIARLERTNLALAEAVSSGDELLSALEELQGLQNQVQTGIREAVNTRARAANVTDVAAPATAASPAAEAAVKPAVVSSAEPVAKARVRSVPAPSKAPEFEIPIAGLPQWLVASALGLISLVLLGWMAIRILSRARGAGSMSGAVSHAPRHDDRDRTTATPAGAQAGAEFLANGKLDREADAEIGEQTLSHPSQPPVDSEERWSNTLISKKAADPQALKEVDILIAFEQYENAKAVLDEMLVKDPDNPELVLRHYHVRTQGGVETTDDDEALLRAMMDGPLSDTMLRVRNLGRGLMPGDPLFDDPAKRAVASHVLKESKRSEAQAKDSSAVADDTVVPFTGTVKLERSPLAGN